MLGAGSLAGSRRRLGRWLLDRPRRRRRGSGGRGAPGRAWKMRAILSVYDKTGIAEFARGLHGLGWEIGRASCRERV